MVKLVALYGRPSEPAEFNAHFSSTHLPLVRKFPGLLRMEVTRVTGAPLGGVKFSIMEEFYFADKDAMDSALASAEGKAVIRDLMTFAADLMTVFYGEADE